MLKAYDHGKGVHVLIHVLVCVYIYRYIHVCKSQDNMMSDQDVTNDVMMLAMLDLMAKRTLPVCRLREGAAVVMREMLMTSVFKVVNAADEADLLADDVVAPAATWRCER